jgi:hypothetical protein
MASSDTKVANRPTVRRGETAMEVLMRMVVLQQYAFSLDGFSCADDSEFAR